MTDRHDAPETMLGDTAVAVHPDPAAALAEAEAELRENLRPRRRRSSRPIQAHSKTLAERRRTMLPHLMKLRDMALCRPEAAYPARGPRDSARGRRVGQA